MHGFWLRFIVAGGTTSVGWIISVRMSIYGITVSMLGIASVFIVMSAIAWISVGKQLYLDSFYSGDFNLLGEDILLGKDKPW